MNICQENCAFFLGMLVEQDPCVEMKRLLNYKQHFD